MVSRNICKCAAIVGGIWLLSGTAISSYSRGLDSFFDDVISVAGCSCGCNMTLNTCITDMPTCTDRPKIVRQMRQSLEAGKPNLLTIVPCPCGCNLTLEICEKEMPDCTTAPEVITKIKQFSLKNGVEDTVLKNISLSMSGAERAIARAMIANKYAILHFYREGSRGYKENLKILEEAESRWKDRAAVVIANVEDPEEKELVGRYRVGRTPLTLVVASNGAITAGFPGRVELKRLETGFVSEKMAEVLKAIQAKKTVFITVGESQIKYSEESSRAARDAVKMLAGIAEVVEVDPRDKGEELLLAQLKIKPDLDSATTVVVAPSGVIVEKFTGKITKRDLFDSFQKVLAMQQGCGAPTATGGSACQPRRGVAGQSGCQ